MIGDARIFSAASDEGFPAHAVGEAFEVFSGG
jgi:hypothetical protein